MDAFDFDPEKILSHRNRTLALELNSLRINSNDLSSKLSRASIKLITSESLLRVQRFDNTVLKENLLDANSSIANLQASLDQAESRINSLRSQFTSLSLAKAKTKKTSSSLSSTLYSTTTTTTTSTPHIHPLESLVQTRSSRHYYESPVTLSTPLTRFSTTPPSSPPPPPPPMPLSDSPPLARRRISRRCVPLSYAEDEDEDEDKENHNSTASKSKSKTKNKTKNKNRAAMEPRSVYR
ncbi:hypothetical protein ScalyP_jg4482 [Parmales sp. scaly parma]|nr:hypothetical protein ScalyP_jg4482 [Parmales sp. scaly parma]